MSGGEILMEKKVNVEVIGPHPPCPRCTTVLKNTEKAASLLKSDGIEVTVKKLDIASKDVVSKYGVLMSPALALNGTVKVMGRIPDVKEVERLVKEVSK